ncbi:MAG TPA: hypothetical protein DCM68_01825 [Verrucomicrobia bacterium]|nr:hypothetical protein [Verrucomicrobiota bacterium]
MNNPLPKRKTLPHAVPAWVQDGAIFFITINALNRFELPLLQDNRPALLWDSVKWRMDKSHWWPHLFLLMPDHLHLLASFPKMSGMQEVVRNWKHWTSDALGIQWQRGFFDHRIRNLQEFDEKAAYIRLNPVRKKLVASVAAWPHVWEMPFPVW